jgi:hypothetical protein
MRIVGWPPSALGDATLNGRDLAVATVSATTRCRFSTGATPDASRISDSRRLATSAGS